MKKKLPLLPFLKVRGVEARSDDLPWHNGGDLEIDSYARSLHRAAKAIIASLDRQPNSMTEWNACPAVLLYRECIELRMKTLIGEGCCFLPAPTDPITLSKTHSLRWLAQIVCQIIRAVKWESEFKCEGGISNLADFSAAVNELAALDPVTIASLSARRLRTGGSAPPPQLQLPSVMRFAPRLDSLINLLDETADALAACAHQVSGEDDLPTADDSNTTIH